MANNITTYNLLSNDETYTQGVPVVFSFSGLPDWKEQTGDLLFNFKNDSPPTPNTCFPDFIQLNGNSVSFSIDSCDGYQDWKSYVGTVDVDINCCPSKENVCNPDKIVVDGSNAIFNFISSTGTPDKVVVPATNALFDFNCFVENTEFICYPDFISHYGLRVDINWTSKSSFPDFINGNGLTANVDFDCFDEQSQQGELVLVSGDIKEELVIESEITVFDVPPTIDGRVVLEATIYGAANFRRRFFVEGDVSLDDFTVESEIEFTHISTIYYANIRLDAKVEGKLDFVEGFVGDITMDDLSIEGKLMAPNVVVDSSIQIGEFIFNRGWIHHGDPDAPEAREFYEATGIESMQTVWHPTDAKYAIFVPTMSYNIRNVELRHGTLVYTLNFEFDAFDVQTVKVWLMDEGGNAIRDTIAKTLNGEKLNHDLNNPFDFTLTIPVHCINERKYKFYLEIVYKNKNYLFDGDSDLKSHYLHFNPEYKDKREYINLNDRITVNSSTFETQKPLFIDSYVEQVSTYESFTERVVATVPDSHDHGVFSASVVEFSTTYESYVEIINLVSCSHVNQHNAFAQTYFELDVGQIGG